MGLERTPGASPRERTIRSRERTFRTFAQLFPWRNMRRVIMLLALIVAIIVIKRSMGPLLGRASQLWGLGSPPSAPAPAATPTGVGPDASFRVHLGPTLARPPQPAPRPPSDR